MLAFLFCYDVLQRGCYIFLVIIYFKSILSYFCFSFVFSGKLRKTYLKLGKTDGRSSHRRCSVRRGVLGNFAKFTGKHLCQNLYFNKVAGNIFFFGSSFGVKFKCVKKYFRRLNKSLILMSSSIASQISAQIYASIRVTVNKVFMKIQIFVHSSQIIGLSWIYCRP